MTDHILVADDDQDDHLFLTEAFSGNSFKGRLSFVTDGQQLMEFLRAADSEQKPALILLDLNMPRVDGFMALKQIKADSALRDIPVVVVTSSHNIKDRNACFELGCEQFITKPDNIQEYQTITKTFLNMLTNPT